MPITEKGREQRLRRLAEREGYSLRKSQARDPDNLDFGGYNLFDHDNGFAVFPFIAGRFVYSADLNEVEAWLTAGT